MGRPLGSLNKDKPWQEALRIVVFESDANGIKRLRRIAEQCVAAAEGGDMAAIKEIGDRLDGKPAQEQTVTHERRDGEDWTRGELTARLEQSDARNGGNGTAPTNGRGGGPDSVH